MSPENKQFSSLSFRVPHEFAEETKRLAGEQPLSQYLRDAVREKNEREMAQRIRFLSGRLSAQSLEVAQEFDDAVGDGI